MKLTSTLRGLIIESGRFQVLYDQNVVPNKKGNDGKPLKGVMDFDTLKKIIIADPTSRIPENFDIEGASVNDMNKVKPGGYTQWLINRYKSPELNDDEKNFQVGTPEFNRAVKRARDLFLEDLYKTTEDLKTFTKIKQYLPEDQRDINKYTIRSLFETLENFELPEKYKQKQEKNIAKKSREGFNHAGSEIIFSDDKWTVVKIEDKGQLGKDAAIYFGGYQDSSNNETRWCTSAPGLTYFEGYIKDGPLYVVLPNDDKGEVGNRTGLPKERYQFHFPSSQFMDRTDKQINLVEFLNNNPELKGIFKPEFAKGLTSREGLNVEINYPDSSAGKYVALYGFEELFTSLPDNIVSLTINNRSSNEKVSLDVPPSISRFKNLEILLMRNILKSLPNEIGELKELTFLSLPNNPELTTIPETVADLDNLTFINIQNSPNVKFPPRLAEKVSEGDEAGLYWVV